MTKYHPFYGLLIWLCMFAWSISLKEMHILLYVICVLGGADFYSAVWDHEVAIYRQRKANDAPRR